MGWKYIIIERDGYQYPILFPDAIKHADVSLGIYGEVLSAGFISGLQIAATGGLSESLQVNSRAVDTDIINTYTVKKGVGYDMNPAPMDNYREKTVFPVSKSETQRNKFKQGKL